MKRIALLLLVIVLVIVGCFRLGVKGDGTIQTEDRPVSDFTNLVVSGAYEVQWSHGKPGLTITTDQNLLPHIKTEVSGNTLKIDSDNHLRPTKGIVVILSSDSLADAQMAGAITMKASQIAGEQLKLESTGASNISLDGTVTKLEANLTGACRLSAHALQTKSATLALTGASNADITVSDALKVTVTGAGTLTYAGDPPSVEKNITGAGNVRRRE